jgi:hypothetical protein
MKRPLLFLTLLLFVAACGASINPLLQQKISGLFSKSSSQSFPAREFTKPLPYAVGQYTVVGITTDGTKMISRIAIVGKEQGGWILETHSISESNENVTQMLVKGMEKVIETGNVDDVDIVWVKTQKDAEAVQTIDGPVLSITKSFYRKGMLGFTYSTAKSTSGGGVTVPAGTFAGTTRIHSEGSVFGRTFEADGWFHPIVPINGMVKSVSTDGSTMQELLEFGTNATRSF